jgi:hypothetical protein
VNYYSTTVWCTCQTLVSQPLIWILFLLEIELFVIDQYGYWIFNLLTPKSIQGSYIYLTLLIIGQFLKTFFYLWCENVWGLLYFLFFLLLALINQILWNQCLYHFVGLIILSLFNCRIAEHLLIFTTVLEYVTGILNIKIYRYICSDTLSFL